MKTDTSQKIIDYIGEHRQATPHELGEWLGISQVAVHKQLKKLVEKGSIQKWGKPPKVFYVWAEDEEFRKTWGLEPELSKFLKKNYLYITPTGEIKYGMKGFYEWATKTIKAGYKSTPEELAQDYMRFRQKANEMRNKDGLLDGLAKLKSTFKKVFVDELYYVDFYALPRFGKTKLGQMMLYAKQSQNRHLTLKIAEMVKSDILRLIASKRVTHVAFIPPTIPRKTQFMKELESALQLQLPKVDLTKVHPGADHIIVAQKSLSKLDERVENAAKSFFPESKSKWQNLLLIDDAVGSGATMNQVARKLKEQRGDTEDVKIIGLGLTGSFKGFEVIREL